MVDYLRIDHEPAAHCGSPEDRQRARGSWLITGGLTTSPRLVVDYLGIDHEPAAYGGPEDPAGLGGLPED